MGMPSDSTCWTSQMLEHVGILAASGKRVSPQGKDTDCLQTLEKEVIPVQKEFL